MSIKRKGNFTYLQKVHNGNAYWLNCVLLNKDFLRYYTNEIVPYQRGVGYYYLGLGLSNISKLPAGGPTVKALSQLMEEYEYFMASAMMQSVKYVAAKTATSPYGAPTSIRNNHNNSSNSHNHHSSTSEVGGFESAPPSRNNSLQDSQSLLAAFSTGDTEQPPPLSFTGNNVPFSSGNGCISTEGVSANISGDITTNKNITTSTNDKGRDDNSNGNSNSLYKFNGEVVFQYFMTPVIPMELYYPEVSYITCSCILIHTFPNIRTYTHTYMHTYLHTYIHTYIHLYVHIHIHNFIHIYILALR